jgi:hypothetical protein
MTKQTIPVDKDFLIALAKNQDILKVAQEGIQKLFKSINDRLDHLETHLHDEEIPIPINKRPQNLVSVVENGVISM